jgi:tRNA threonylcarbamoyladenosine biosynthesis protein TsaE
MMSTHWSLAVESEWEPVVRHIIADLTGRDLFFLEGPLGAGKTTFVRHFMRALGGKHVTSPTFAIHHAYLPGGPSSALVGPSVQHLDLFRIQSVAEWNQLGLEDLFLEPRGLVFVEWASRLPHEVWPPGWRTRTLTIKLSDAGDAREVFLSS